MRTYSAPPSTATAPTAAPIQRSLTQPSNIGLDRPTPSSGLFGGRGLLGGLAAGFLGAGLFGLPFGYGLFGGMAGFASIFGLILQVLLIIAVARLVFAWWQRRNLAAAPAYEAPNPAASHNFGSFGGILNTARSQPSSEPLAIANSITARLNGCLATFKPPTLRKTFRLCAPWSLRRCCLIFLKSWRPTRVTVSSIA
jgi:predicted lipid-binding transport protein (Tim44 family)